MEDLVVYPGFDSGLRVTDNLGRICVIHSTGEIGRSFLWAEQSLLALKNPLYNASAGELENSLAVRLYRSKKRLKILNIGCGGCADIPLLEELIIKSLQESGLQPDGLEIVNADLSEKTLEAVQSGKHPYFICDYSPRTRNMVDGATEEEVKESIAKHFIPGPKIKTREINYFWLDLDAQGGTPIEQERERDSYFMREASRRKLRLEKADIRSLPYRSGSFDFVIAHHVLKYLEGKKEVKKAIKELLRVVRDRGVVFPHCAIYQKQAGLIKSNFERISGRIYGNKADSKFGGLLPTCFYKGEYRPFSLDHQEREDGQIILSNDDLLFTGYQLALPLPIELLSFDKPAGFFLS